MVKIFISYRREDSKPYAGRIYDRLITEFGKDNVFKDVDSIPLGIDFRGKLREAVAKCDILLALIGRQWLTITNKETSKIRLHEIDDYLKIEIEIALQREECITIPLLLDDAPMPKDYDLPSDLQKLAFIQAKLVRDDPDFHNDMSKLIAFIREQFPQKSQTTKKTPGISKPKSSSVQSTPKKSTRGKISNQTNNDSVIEDLLKELEKSITPHRRRLEIGDFLDSIGDGDTREGVGVNEYNIPNIKWCFVEEDGELMIERKKFKISPFYISKYLITNIQYESFINADDGYYRLNWWNGFPPNYHPEASIRPSSNKKQNYPRNSLSWYQCVAFSRWLDDKYRDNNLFDALNLSSEEYQIRLPTEWEWQWMAQNGREKREYAWGSWATLPYANTSESHLQQITSVGMYPKAKAECGALDVNGNLCEWCLNDYSDMRTISYNKESLKSSRGGSFTDDYIKAENTYRSNPSNSRFGGSSYTSFSSNSTMERMGCRIIIGKKSTK